MPAATAVSVENLPLPRLVDYTHPDTGQTLDVWFAANYTTAGIYLLTVRTATDVVYITATVTVSLHRLDLRGHQPSEHRLSLPTLRPTAALVVAALVALVTDDRRGGVKLDHHRRAADDLLSRSTLPAPGLTSPVL